MHNDFSQETLLLNVHHAQWIMCLVRVRVCVCVCVCVCLQFTIGEIVGKLYLMASVYFGYAHSQSQAVILQVLGVGGGFVGERGVGDELSFTY